MYLLFIVENMESMEEHAVGDGRHPEAATHRQLCDRFGYIPFPLHTNAFTISTGFPFHQIDL